MSIMVTSTRSCWRSRTPLATSAAIPTAIFLTPIATAMDGSISATSTPSSRCSAGAPQQARQHVRARLGLRRQQRIHRVQHHQPRMTVPPDRLLQRPQVHRQHQRRRVRLRPFGTFRRRYARRAAPSLAARQGTTTLVAYRSWLLASYRRSALFDGNTALRATAAHVASQVVATCKAGAINPLAATPKTGTGKSHNDTYDQHWPQRDPNEKLSRPMPETRPPWHTGCYRAIGATICPKARLPKRSPVHPGVN